MAIGCCSVWASATPRPTRSTADRMPPWSITSTGSMPAESRPIGGFLRHSVPERFGWQPARTLGSHPYLVVPDHTREARQILGPDVVIAPEQTVVVEADPDTARNIGRAFVSNPYLELANYTNNFRRYGYSDADIEGGGSDRLIDALVLYGSADIIAAGLRAQFEAGADHIGIQVLTADGEDPMPGYRQLARVLL